MQNVFLLCVIDGNQKKEREKKNDSEKSSTRFSFLTPQNMHKWAVNGHKVGPIKGIVLL